MWILSSGLFCNDILCDLPQSLFVIWNFHIRLSRILANSKLRIQSVLSQQRTNRRKHLDDPQWAQVEGFASMVAFCILLGGTYKAYRPTHLSARLAMSSKEAGAACENRWTLGRCHPTKMQMSSAVGMSTVNGSVNLENSSLNPGWLLTRDTPQNVIGMNMAHGKFKQGSAVALQ